MYTWVAYINPDFVNAFAKKYNCKVQITTFNTMNEALAKLRSGLNYDCCSAPPSTSWPTHRVQAGPAAQPLLHPEHHPGLA